MAPPKRGPSVLVTDSRERPPSRSAQQHRPGAIAASGTGRMPMRFISVDNVLQYASEIPSGQPRLPPGISRPAGYGSTSSHGAHVRRGSMGSGGGLPNLASRTTGQQNMPSRTTKISEKLVLLPETTEGKEELDEDDPEELPPTWSTGEEDEARPLRDEELDVLRKRGGIRGKSYAERLPKVKRTEEVSRLTAYCTAQAFKMSPTAEFLRSKHDAKTKLYDDCLYTVYHLPLLPGLDGYRLRSRPIMKTPGSGKTLLDLEIEMGERRDHYDGYFDEYAFHTEAGSPGAHNARLYPMSPEERSRRVDGGDQDERHTAAPPSPGNRLAAAEAKNFAEMFVFSYGVVVFWNFSEHQEKDILADLTFAENETGISHMTRALDQDDYETEEFHFEYSAKARRPRVFNDMITLLPHSDHMTKLTISHAIAQSTKLCLFEAQMSETMLDAQPVPKRLALTGELNMTRTEIVRILGRLFKSRVDINLSSNILDVPNFFWDSEPTLHPLYVAIREYLEIDPRIRVLNERCRVFLDLAEILSDSIADAKMSSITWIIIILIVVSIAVTVTEVGLRFGILQSEKNKMGTGVGANEPAAMAPACVCPSFTQPGW